MQRGRLISWQAERGFGFIKPHMENAPNVFIHISALKQMARLPEVGDEILYQADLQADGKTRAVIARIEGVAIKKEPRAQEKHRSTKSLPRLIKTLAFIAIAALVIPKIIPLLNQTAEKLPASERMTQPIATQVLQPLGELPVQQTQFRCEGKTHCSHMRSCDEAVFYLKNCPNTEMDGDKDGIPCESQWCR